MELRFTRHAYEKMRLRSITETEVFEVFENKLLVLEKGEAIMIGKTHRNRYLTLVIDMERGVLITLWPSSRRQRRLYENKMGGTKS